MDRFVARYRSVVAAVLCGFDRLVFRGSLLPLIIPQGMYNFLKRADVQLLDFKDYDPAPLRKRRIYNLPGVLRKAE